MKSFATILVLLASSASFVAGIPAPAAADQAASAAAAGESVNAAASNGSGVSPHLPTSPFCGQPLLSKLKPFPRRFADNLDRASRQPTTQPWQLRWPKLATVSSRSAHASGGVNYHTGDGMLTFGDLSRCRNHRCRLRRGNGERGRAGGQRDRERRRGQG